VQRNGRRVRTAHLIVLFQGNGLGSARFGLTVSRKVGNAVKRNRVKRWLREAIRRGHGGRFDGLDVVFIARSGTPVVGFHALKAEVDQALDDIEGCP